MTIIILPKRAKTFEGTSFKVTDFDEATMMPHLPKKTWWQRLKQIWDDE